LANIVSQSQPTQLVSNAALRECTLPDFPPAPWFTDHTKPEHMARRKKELVRYTPHLQRSPAVGQWWLMRHRTTLLTMVMVARFRYFNALLKEPKVLVLPKFHVLMELATDAAEAMRAVGNHILDAVS
jgi:hypothetical protein